MSDPKRHHYLPEFYQRRWVNADNEVTVYRRFSSGLDIKHKPPSAIGFEKELYSIRSLDDPKRRQELETVFMSAVDNVAAQALTFMEESGRPPEDPRLRNGWARFIMRLLNSSPRRIEYFRRELQAHELTVLEEIEATYEAKRKPDEPATFTEFMETTDKTLTDRTLAQLVQGLVDSPMIGEALVRMRWAIMTLPDETYDLLASDMPLMRSNGLGDQMGFAIMPLGPRRLFIGAHHPDVIRSFASQRPKALVRGLNSAIVEQAEHFVIARDESQTKFIDRRLGRGDPHDRARDTTGDLTWRAPLVVIPEKPAVNLRK